MEQEIVEPMGSGPIGENMFLDMGPKIKKLYELADSDKNVSVSYMKKCRAVPSNASANAFVEVCSPLYPIN